MSESETADVHENNSSFDLVESTPIHSDLLQNRTFEVLKSEELMD